MQPYFSNASFEGFRTDKKNILSRPVAFIFYVSHKDNQTDIDNKEYKMFL